MGPNPQFPVDLVHFAGEILNGKLHFLSSAKNVKTCEPSLHKRGCTQTRMIRKTVQRI